MTPPDRHWRSYTDDPLPSPAEALAEPFGAFPSWFLRIECDRCGKVRMLHQAHVTAGQRRMLLRDFLVRARHEGCGGQRRRSCPGAARFDVVGARRSRACRVSRRPAGPDQVSG